MVNRVSPARAASALFASGFGGRPPVVTSAPGRVNLIGEHTDYNGGPVLPLALERRTAAAAAPADDWLVASTVDGRVRAIKVDAPPRKEWTDYVAGVVRELRQVDAAPAGAQLAIHSNLPLGAGLASSAALTVTVAKALSLLAGRRLTPAQLVDVAFRAEHDRVGVHCGRMDQTVAVLAERGTALLLQTASGAVQRTPFPGRIGIVETGVSHKLVGGELNRRREECEAALTHCREWRPGLRHLADLVPGNLSEVARHVPPPLLPRVRHVVTETARTREAAAALARGDLARVGTLLVEGHESLRADYQSSVAEADFVVEAALRHGAHGARLTGAGWGGAVVVLAPADREARVLAEVGRDFRDRFGRPVECWSSRAASGVRREAVPV